MKKDSLIISKILQNLKNFTTFEKNSTKLFIQLIVSKIVRIISKILPNRKCFLFVNKILWNLEILLTIGKILQNWRISLIVIVKLFDIRKIPLIFSQILRNSKYFTNF